MQDPYVYCRTCHDSERPLHGLLGTDWETWSLMVQEAAVDIWAPRPGSSLSCPGLRCDGADQLEVQWDDGMIPVATLEPIELPVGTEPERTPVRGLPKRRKAWRWEEAKLGLVQKPGEVQRL